jgi:hypothetical protein
MILRHFRHFHAIITFGLPPLRRQPLLMPPSFLAPLALCRFRWLRFHAFRYSHCWR